jgi:hypothetical protein
MSINKVYGVACKNAECNKRIVLGEYMTPRRSEEEPEDPIPLIRFTARKITCPKCHKTYQYHHSDLREFPAKVSVKFP